MNEADTKAKQQIVEKIKSSSNILVVVSKDPSVDDLTAALGLTALLNKLDKHATAIFSGIIPPAIAFLDPTRTFENTVDSLRDFIIALDKEKADHLRYKVEGDVVKIFITPYRTTITSDDLEFSQGDYNVDFVLALGVSDQTNLDDALAQHGQILHDVTVATISAGVSSSRLGSIDWRDENASSLSEMIMSISEALKTDKTLLDKQISTALLTGIVASTDRFSNNRTTSRVMTMAAQLMASGADQQLIAAKLQEAHEINSFAASIPKQEMTQSAPVVEQPVKQPGMLTIEHEEEPVIERPRPNLEPVSNINVSAPAEQVVETIPEPVQPQATEFPMASTLPTASPFEPEITPTSTVPIEVDSEPLLGGTLNATTEQAAEEARQELADQQNRTILTHSYLGSTDPNVNSNGFADGRNDEIKGNIDIFAEPSISTLPPAPQIPQSVDLPMPPPLPDFSTLPPSTPPVFEINHDNPPVDQSSSTLPPISPSDPGQFRIPGQ